MDNNSACTIYLIRHGETEWNEQGRMQGQTDTLLTPKGEEQAAQTAEKLKGIKFDAVFSSDLIRAKRTAEIIKLERNLEIVTTKALRERAFGHHEGKLINDYNDDIKDLLNEYRKLPEEKKWQFKFADEYESDLDLASRWITFLREIAVAYSGKKVLVVGHGSAIKVFLIKIGYIKYHDIRNFSILNAGCIKLTSDGVDFKVEDASGLHSFLSI